MSCKSNDISAELTYVNRKGDTYYFSKKMQRGKERIIASRKKGDEPLTQIPDGMEIYETPNGQVFCRRKMNSLITTAEVERLEEWKSKLSGQAVFCVERKERELIVHSAECPSLPFGGHSPFMDPFLLARCQSRVHYGPTVKFELIDEKTRVFALFRMCYRGLDEHWIPLRSGKLGNLANMIMPTLETDAFYDLI